MMQHAAQPGMGPGHPAMAYGHPLQQVHHGGHMGQPNAVMMQNMHSMAGPQVTQGAPMSTGMPPNPGTPAAGGPMPGHMAMAHLGGQGPMFAGQNPNMNMAVQMPMNQQNMVAMHRAKMQQAGQMAPGMMAMPNMNHLSAAQIQQMQQMKGIPMQQMQQQMTPQQQQIIAQHQQTMHHQRMLQAQALNRATQQQQQQQAQAQQAQQQQQQQAAMAQHIAMQNSRSQQEQTTQPPQPVTTPAPQAPPQPITQSQPPPSTAAQQTPQQKPQQLQPPTSQPPQTNATTPQIKQGDPDDETQVKPEASKQQILMDEMARPPPQNFSGQCTLQLLSLYDNLANPTRPNDLAYWQDVMAKYYSEYGSIRQSFFSQRTQVDKSFQLQYPSLARFYYTQFKNGIRKILMQSFEHMQEELPNGGYRVWSKKLHITYEYNDGVRIMTHGLLFVNFDESQKIEHLHMNVKGWTEYIPRQLLVASASLSPEQSRQSPKLTKKNLPKNQGRPQQNLPASPLIPASPVGEYGFPAGIIGFLEIAEVMTYMMPLMDYSKEHSGLGPRESLNRINAENNQAQLNMQRMQQSMNAAAANGQGQFPNPRGMPNQFQSPALMHLGLPQGQGSPHMGGPNQTPSPAHHAQGGVQMVQQMSAQGSNMSGSQGASTNTSPNVTAKRRRASVIKDEDSQPQAGDSKTKPSPRTNKRAKGAPA